jgi:hypothetical protein
LESQKQEGAAVDLRKKTSQNPQLNAWRIEQVRDVFEINWINKVSGRARYF